MSSEIEVRKYTTRDWIRVCEENIRWAERKANQLAEPSNEADYDTYRKYRMDSIALTWYIAVTKRGLHQLQPQQPKYQGASVIRQIKENTDIIEVTSRYTRLRGNGNQYYGRCPFHKDRTASLSVDSNKNLWHCFGCGKGGDVLDFIKLAENLDTGGAIKLLMGTN